MLIVRLIILISVILSIYHILNIFQQAHYNIKDYINYQNRFFIYRIIPILLSFIILLNSYTNVKFIVSLYILIYNINLIKIPKVKLRFTNRIKRLMILVLLFMGIVFFYPHYFCIFNYLALIPFFASNLIEGMINKIYLKKATKKRNKFYGDVIAITGSFGKTTTKLYMAQILNELHPFYTEKSYNTPMGISMSLNCENIDIYNKLILEFGATKKGDIKYLSKKFRPNIGIVTSIGYMHMNSFKDINNIVNEKMSLIEDLESNSIAILNYDCEYIRNYIIKNKVRIISFGYNNGDIRIKSNNSYFFLDYLGIRIGEYRHNNLTKNDILDLLPGIILYKYYGLKDNKIDNIIYTIKRPLSRLNVIKELGNTLIDDSFNSNLSGALCALEMLNKQEGKKFIITPGFVENDKVVNFLNQEYLKKIKEVCDYLFIIHSSSGDLLYKESTQNRTYMVNDLRTALKIINKFELNKSVLIENDLTDYYQDMPF